MRRRGEVVERSFAHCLETGGRVRAWLRGRANILKRYLVPVAVFNLGIVMLQILEAGTPRGLPASRGLLVGLVGVLRWLVKSFGRFPANLTPIRRILGPCLGPINRSRV